MQRFCCSLFIKSLPPPPAPHNNFNIEAGLHCGLAISKCSYSVSFESRSPTRTPLGSIIPPDLGHLSLNALVTRVGLGRDGTGKAGVRSAAYLDIGCLSLAAVCKRLHYTVHA